MQKHHTKMIIKMLIFTTLICIVVDVLLYFILLEVNK